ncbi:MAG TPA: hypothetical protein DEB25_03810 [Desulfobulbaceae bacterium]|nr:hypothetical protein [Desulfobulbaceae bacterium]
MNDMKQLMTNRFDLAGMSVFRLARLSALGKFLPLGGMRGGPGLLPLLLLLALHGAGNCFFPFAVRHEARLHRLYNKLRRRD